MQTTNYSTSCHSQYTRQPPCFRWKTFSAGSGERKVCIYFCKDNLKATRPSSEGISPSCWNGRFGGTKTHNHRVLRLPVGTGTFRAARFQTQAKQRHWQSILIDSVNYKETSKW